MKKILFVDLDGTIREPILGKFVDIPENQQVIPGAYKAIQYFNNRGWRVIGISNQEGIGSGYKTLESCIREMWETLKMFPDLLGIVFCPDMQGEDAIIVSRWKMEKFSFQEKLGYAKCSKTDGEKSFRKPETGMFHMAVQYYWQVSSSDFFYLSQQDGDYDCWFIGDRDDDEEAAKNLGIKFLAASTWRNKFIAGMHEANVTPEQLLFLEGIKLSQ